jgi:hypothetical protein
MMAQFTPLSSTIVGVMDDCTNSTSESTTCPPGAGGIGMRRSTPFDRIRGIKDVASMAIESEEESILDDFIAYNDGLAFKPYCINRIRQEGSKEKQCRCLHVLRNSSLFTEAVAEYQLHFGRLKRHDQQCVVTEWIRSSRFHHKGAQKRGMDASLVFAVPFLLSEEWSSSEEFDNLRSATICRDALLDILGWGKKMWTTCLNHARNNTLPDHKLRGKKTNMKRKWDEVFQESLLEHFEDLRKEAGPIATRFVREKSGQTTTRDDNEKAEHLPPTFSKRQCYYNYCSSRGVMVTANNKGTLSFERQPEALPIPSWTSYRSFWNKEYPNLRVSRPTEDICSYCYQFQNSFRCKKRGVSEDEVDGDEEEDDNDDDNPTAAADIHSSPTSPHNPPSLCLPTTTEEEVDSSNDELELQEEQEEVVKEVVVEDEEEQEQDVGDEVLQREKKIDDAVKHVKMARAQRLLVNEKTSLAKQDALASTIHSERTYTFIVDYGQNMALPWFGTSQPGDTYYYTPLTIFNLGVVDVSHPDGEHLYCHLYKEGDGKKGGDNVASLLMKSLRQLNILQGGCRGKELNVVFDNCPGQNKNHHVLWLVPYLVEMGYFQAVNFIFLVVGHTKNAADRRFNNLKMIYRKSNVYTFNQLVEVCGKSPHVTVVPVVDGDFMDYDYFFDLFNGRIAAVTKSHIFSCKRPLNVNDHGSVYTDGTKLLMCVKESILEEHPTKTTNLIKNNMMLFSADGTEGTLQEAVNSRLDLLQRADFLDHIPFKGIPEFKQVQLYRNYRKFIPPAFQDEICPKPSDEVLKRQKDDQKRRADEKKEKKAKKLKA